MFHSVCHIAQAGRSIQSMHITTGDAIKGDYRLVFVVGSVQCRIDKTLATWIVLKTTVASIKFDSCAHARYDFGLQLLVTVEKYKSVVCQWLSLGSNKS